MTRFAALMGALLAVDSAGAAEPPPLPEKNGPVELAAQEWPLRPGPRTIRVTVHYPGGTLAKVNETTGLMLTLHNWGGTDCVGTADPKSLADRYNVVALCVNYLQSGKADSIDGPEAYDFGYLQALDALRALHWLESSLTRRDKPFSPRRTYCTGGSGGGNVSLMAAKLAPRTFACVIDLCGMKKLSDDIAFNLPGGSDLNARWSRDPKHANHLTLDHQELRFLGNPIHLAEMKRLKCETRFISVHGRDDTTCPFADAEEFAFRMKRANLDFTPVWIGKSDLDGKAFTSSGHALGNRTEIVDRVAQPYLVDGGRVMAIREDKSDFERKETIRYRTSGGSFAISYAEGDPVGRFEPAPPLPEYPDHLDLTYAMHEKDVRTPIRTAADWELRREHVARHVARVMGPLPSPLRRGPLDVKEIESKPVGKLIRKTITFQSDGAGRVPAYLFLPSEKPAKPLPAILALHQTTRIGKGEPAGLGAKDMSYGIELAERGYVVIIPDYPTFGDHAFDHAKGGYPSGSIKAVWDNIRAVDLLETLTEVDADRIGVIGHSLGGHNAIFTAFHDPRLKAVVSSCGFTTFTKDDLPSWTGPTYMPRIKTEFGNDVKRMPFDFPELIAGLAPRAFLAVAAEKDDDFDAGGVRDCIRAAAPVFKRLGGTLEATYPNAGHSFPQNARTAAYEFLDKHLR